MRWTSFRATRDGAQPVGVCAILSKKLLALIELDKNIERLLLKVRSQ